MKYNYYLITGTSRGIGEAMARQLLAENNRLFCISRNQNPQLHRLAETRGCVLKDIALDLANTSKVREVVRGILRKIDPAVVSRIFLIQNAGTVQPIRPVGKFSYPEGFERNLQVNLLAPMVMSDVFIKHTEGWDCDKRIMSISTGAARRPVYGWSAYCSAKAGLEMFTKTVALEQQRAKYPVKITAAAPGVVDTMMQEEIRQAKQENFPEVDKFRAYKEDGLLSSPEDAARSLLEELWAEGFGDESLVDVRD